MIIKINNYHRLSLAQTSRKHWLSAFRVGYFSETFGVILRNIRGVPGNGGVHFRPLLSLGVIFRNSIPQCSLLIGRSLGVIFRNSSPVYAFRGSYIWG